MSEEINININDVKKLVDNLKKLDLQDEKNNKQNFFDICGFPHYENVVSNVIAYFLNNSTFRDLFLNAILECLGIKENEQIVSEVEREVETGDSKRIDLLIETQNYAIAIENKIYANDNGQPYNSYMEYLKNNFKDKKQKMVLLSIFQDKPTSGCKDIICIKYIDLLTKLKNNMGNYIINANIEETILLKNFINNLENIMTNSLNINNEEGKELLKNSEIISNTFFRMYEYKRQLAIDFEEILKKNNFNIINSWLYPSKGYSNEWLSKYCILGDFAQYGQICICLWMNLNYFQIALAFQKSNLEKNTILKKDNMEKDGSWFVINRRNFNYEDDLNILDNCIGYAKEFIENFKNNIDNYFEIKKN